MPCHVGFTFAVTYHHYRRISPQLIFEVRDYSYDSIGGMGCSDSKWQQPPASQTEVQSPAVAAALTSRRPCAGAGRSQPGAQDTADLRFDRAAATQDIYGGDVRCGIGRHSAAGTRGHLGLQSAGMLPDP